MHKMRMDVYDNMPEGMRTYFSNYGWHFSKKMCEFAVSNMKKKDASGKLIPITPYTKDQVDALLQQYGIQVEEKKGFDYVFAANMAKADYLNSSIKDEQHLALFIKDYVCDPDAYEGLPFTRYYADTIGSGTPIIWEEML